MPPIWETRAYAWLQLQDYHAAITDYTQVLKLKPDKRSSPTTTAACPWLRLNDRDSALRDFERTCSWTQGYLCADPSGGDP